MLAGDPKQLPPTVISEAAYDCQLDRTLFDRICDTGAPFRVIGFWAPRRTWALPVLRLCSRACAGQAWGRCCRVGQGVGLQGLGCTSAMQALPVPRA